jgi:putative colanic acid biosynthesis acetyltransferase WcaF
MGRLLWVLVRPLFYLSPRILWGWRCWMLRFFGAKIGDHVQIDPSARVFIPWNLTVGDWSAIGFDACLYNLGPMVIGERVTISQRAHLCGGTHDYTSASMPLVKAPITIGDDVWICADAFVGPGVTIGKQTVLGARSVAVKDLAEGIVAVGHPAGEVGKRKINNTSTDNEPQ